MNSHLFHAEPPRQRFVIHRSLGDANALVVIRQREFSNGLTRYVFDTAIAFWSFISNCVDAATLHHLH